MEKTKNKIRELRLSKNLTQQQLADELHVTKQAISKWEKGKSVPDVGSIQLISSYFGVSADYLINDGVEEAKPETSVLSPQRLNRLNAVLICALAFMFAVIVALSVAVGVLANKNKPRDTVEVNGFEITYLSDETYYIDKTNKTITLKFNVYNATDFTKKCLQKNFSVDNKSLYIVYISPDEHPIAAHEELKIEMLIQISSGDENLGDLRTHSVTVKYAGQAIAKIKW